MKKMYTYEVVTLEDLETMPKVGETFEYRGETYILVDDTPLHTYTVIMGNGEAEEITAYDLDGAKTKAEAYMSLESGRIIIVEGQAMYDDDEGGILNEMLAVSNYYNLAPTDDDNVICRFGDDGFYEDWYDL